MHRPLDPKTGKPLSDKAVKAQAAAKAKTREEVIDEQLAAQGESKPDEGKQEDTGNAGTTQQ